MEHQRIYPVAYQEPTKEVVVAVPHPAGVAGYGTVAAPYHAEAPPVAVYAPVSHSINVCLAPFYFRTYALMFYFVFVSFAWGIFECCWAVATLSAAVGSIGACCVGLLLLPAFSYTWRAFAHVDVALTKTFCPPADLTATVVMRPVCPTHTGLRSWIKVNLLNSFTWRAVTFHIFWRLIWTTITFVTVTSTLSLSLGLLAKPFMGMFGTDPFENCAECGWFLGSHGVYAIDVVLGVVVFYLLCMKVHFLAMIERKVCWAVLGERTVNALDYASYTVVQSPASKLHDSQLAINALVDPSDPKQRATFVPYAIPAVPIVPYAKRGRTHFIRTCAFCACCCVCTLFVLAGVVAGLLAARCATAAKETTPLDFRWSVATASAVGIDLGSAGWGGSVTLREFDNSTSEFAAHGTISYVKASGRDWAAYFDSSYADGVLVVTSTSLRWWDAVRTCASVDFTLDVPRQPQFGRRPSLKIQTANARVIIGAISTTALDAFSSVNIQTSNANVELGQYGPTTADLSVVTSNARISASSINVTGAATLRTSNAQINLGFVQSIGLGVETTNADIDISELRFPAATSSASLSTSNSDIDLAKVVFQPGARATIDARTSNADVEIVTEHMEGSISLRTSNADAEIDNRSGRQLRLTEDSRSNKAGTVGSAGQHTLTVQTSNADAELVLLP